MSNKTNLEIAMEAIGQSVFEMFDKETPKEVESLLNTIDDTYVLIQWPESQELMDEDWFDEESSLADFDKFGSSAYFIPLKRIL